MKKDSDSCIICNRNTAIATGTFIYIMNQETFGNEIKCLQSRFFTEVLKCES